MINVYVPYDGELGVQLGLKLRFLDALIALIETTQASGRSVICVGDFNVARHSKDVHFDLRLVDVDDLVSNMNRAIDVCEAKIGLALRDEVMRILQLLQCSWTQVRELLLSGRRIVELNGNGQCKFALKIGKEKAVQIGQRQSSQNACNIIANPSPILTSDGLVFKPSGVIQIGDLFEVFSKMCNVEFSEQARAAFADIYAKPRACPPVVERFDKLMSTCKLVDTYVHSNPAGRPLGSERFTCWDQYRNERYENKGARIDYIFVDDTLVSSVRLLDNEDQDGKLLDSLSVSSDRTKALQAVTAEGRWRPVPFTGGGMEDSISESSKNFEFIFSNPPQTGIIYTAPLFSDHVATSCVLDMAQISSEGISERISDSLGLRWKNDLTECKVVAQSHASKSHSLKDMFSRAAEKKQQSAPAEVITLDDSPETCKKVRITQ
jgi:exonuclease III